MSSSFFESNKKPSIAIGVLIGLISQFTILNLLPHLNWWGRLAFFVLFSAAVPLAFKIFAYFSIRSHALNEFAKFGAVGFLNFFVDLGVLNLAISLSGITSGLAFSGFKTLSFIAAVSNSFFWNKFWTFESRSRVNQKELFRFYAVASIGGLINIGIASYVVNVVVRPEIFTPVLWANIGSVMGVFGGVLFNFFGYKNLVFKRA